MGLVSCQRCSLAVSSDLVKCPRCGSMMITQTDTGSLKQVGARRESSLTMWGGFLVTVGAIVALVSASLDFVGDRDIEISLPAVGIAVAGLILWILGKVLARS